MAFRKVCEICGKKVGDNEFVAEMHWITKGHYPVGEDFAYTETSERWKKAAEEREAAKAATDNQNSEATPDEEDSKS